MEVVRCFFSLCAAAGEERVMFWGKKQHAGNRNRTVDAGCGRGEVGEEGEESRVGLSDEV